VNPCIALPAALGLTALLAGCGSSSKGPVAVPPTHVGAPGARVTFIYPRPGAVVGPDLTVRVALKNFALAPYKSGTAVVQGVGQLHFSMDGGRFDQPRYSGLNGLLAARLRVNGKYSLAFVPTITYSGLPSGRHTLDVYLANKDRSATGVSAQVSFTVR
jgi:predicted small lipoprotein YifL